MSKDRRGTNSENVESEDAMRRPQIVKRLKKKTIILLHRT